MSKNTRTRWRGVTAAAALLALVIGPFVATGSTDSAVAVTPPGPPAADAINGLVWLDADADGIADASEQPFPGVTVRLLDSSLSVHATTSTDGDGFYAFPALDSGPWTVEVTAPARYTISEGGADNDVTRAGSPTVGRSPATAPGIGVDAAVRPQWEVDLGTWGGGLLSGTSPFVTDGASACPGVPAAGDDCGDGDSVIRSQDTITFRWAVSASNPEGTLGGPLADVVLEHTVTPGAGASLRPGALPAECTAGGGGGTPPPTSRVTVNADGSILLVCNLGEWSDSGTAELIQFEVFVEPSPHGSTVSSRAVAYATADEVVGGDGSAPTVVTPGAVPSAAIEDALTVSSAFRYDLNKALFETQLTRYVDPDDAGPLPVLRGRTLQYVVGVSTPTRGNEPLEQPITFVEDMFFAAGTQTTPFAGGDIEHYLLECVPNNVASGAVPFGADSAAQPSSREVANSGTCTFSRTGDETSPYEIVLDGIDDSGAHYPTTYANGTGDLSAGPYFVAAYRMRIFIPDRAVDALDGIPANGAGSGWAWNRLGDFTPASVTGGANYGGAGEPGLCDPAHDPYAASPIAAGCATMPGGATSNDVVPGTPISIAPPSFQAGRAKSFHEPVVSQAWGDGSGRTLRNLNGAASGHLGNGVKAPGQIVLSRFTATFGGEVGALGVISCDVFDGSTLRLTPASDVYAGAPADVYVWLNNPGTSPALGDLDADWIYEFGTFDLSADDPLFNAGRVGATGVVDAAFHPGPDTYSTATGRYEGDWSAQRAAANSCATTTPPSGWHTDPADVPGGVDAVNAVRVRAAQPTVGYGNTQSTTAIAPQWLVPLTIRDTFAGGTRNGARIPDSTVLANFTAARFTREDTGAVSDLATSYQPSPESSDQNGDRVTLSRATLSIVKNTITVGTVGAGASAPEVTGAANAGDTIVWRIQPSAAAADGSYELTGLRVTDVLPEYVAYDASCTASLPGGTPPDLVEPNTPTTGQTRLTWLLPDQSAATPLPELRICTLTDATAPSGTNVVNSATVSATGLPDAATDTHTVVLAQPGQIALQKYVDASLDDLGDDQQYRLVVKNLSGAVSMDAVKVIEVFPHADDATNPAGVNRTPGSDFSGSLALTGPVSATFSDDPATPAVPGAMLYTADPPATVSPDWNLNTSRWCAYDAGASTFSGVTGSGPCPASLADVTAVKFEATDPLQPNSQAGGTRDTLTLAFTLQASGNGAGDLYANRFTAFTPTIVGGTGLQMLQSNRVEVRVLEFVLGDLVFADLDDDGVYTPGVDGLAPDGVDVELWSTGPDGVVGGGDDMLVGATQTAGGTYRFRGLPAGSYFVRIPATVFDGGALDGWSVSPHLGMPGEDDDISQDGSADGGGLVSSVHTLAYDLVAGLPAGRSPLGDDRHGVSVPAHVTDGFTDLTLDLAVVPPPAPTTGELALWKVVVDPDPNDSRGDAAFFPVAVTCVIGGTPVVITTTLDRAGTPVVIPNLDAGATCSALETDADGGIPSYSAPSVTIVAGDVVQIVVTNRYPAPLAFTGSTLEGTAVLAAALVGIGGLLWARSRRRAVRRAT